MSVALCITANWAADVADGSKAAGARRGRRGRSSSITGRTKAKPLKRPSRAPRVLAVRKALDADRANRRPGGRPKTLYNGNGNVQGFKAPTGNSIAAALRRLERHRPDLLNRVLAGEISAHAAMLAAGFRKRGKRQKANSPHDREDTTPAP